MTKVISFTLLALLLVSCRSNVKISQEATATAYAAESMQEAMEIAEESAMVLCNLNLDQSPEYYVNSICSLSTELTCSLLKEEIRDKWTEMQTQYVSTNMVCEKSTSRLLEIGEQYGKRVQYWRVNLLGVQGFGTGLNDQVFWLQVAEENGHWKFNRALDAGEISMYFALEQMEQG